MNTARFLSNAFGDRYLYEVNRNTFARIGAVAQFQRAFGEDFARPDTLHIVIGTDSGLLPRYLCALDRPPGSRYLFIELPELMPLIRQQTAACEDAEDIILTTPDQWQEALQGLNLADYIHTDSVRVRESLGATDAFLEDYLELSNTIQQQLEALLWSYTQRLGHPLFIATQIHNLVHNRVPAITLKDSFAGRSALVLGGGPSLDAILPWARDHQDEILIIAVSRISRRLIEFGLRPHIVVTVDPNQMSFEVSREMLLLDPDTLLVNAYHASFKLLSQWPGRSVYLGNRYPWREASEPDNIGATGPTVTNAAIELATLLGIRQIILGGVDLCHDSQGYTHARGSIEHELGPRPAARDIEVETNAGGQATTTPDFYNAMLSIQGQAQQASQLGIEIINPAPGAARMQDVRHLPLEQIDYHPLSRPPGQALAECLGPETPAERLEHYRELSRATARVNGRLRAMIRLAEEGLDANARLFGRKGKPADFRFKKRMDKIERQLDRKYKDLAGLVKMFSAKAFLRMPPSDREWTDEELEQAGITYYTAYRDNARHLLELVELAQEDIELAIAEESDPPHIPTLAEHWREHDTPGRARVWRHRHPRVAANLDPGDITRLDRLDGEFQQQIQSRETLHQRLLRQSQDINAVRSRLHMLYQRQDRQAIAQLRSQLEQLDDPQAAELAILASGYLALLDQSPQTAFEHFARLIELAQTGCDDGAPNPRLEDALCNMATIAMDQDEHQKALLILETLAELSPNYIPQFGELLRLTGHYPEAEAVYSDYLRDHPDDLSIMLSLGRLYQEQGAHDSARVAFEHILARDPANESARVLLDQLESHATP